MGIGQQGCQFFLGVFVQYAELEFDPEPRDRMEKGRTCAPDVGGKSGQRIIEEQLVAILQGAGHGHCALKDMGQRQIGQHAILRADCGNSAEKVFARRPDGRERDHDALGRARAAGRVDQRGQFICVALCLLIAWRRGCDQLVPGPNAFVPSGCRHAGKRDDR
ncbi:hypothetical protein D9M71_179240 [compost metagenome]